MSPPRVYVAGGSSEAALVASLIKRLRAAGVEVTLDWPALVLEHLAAGSPERHDDVIMANADLCAAAVRRADLVWWMVPEKLSEGASYEAGLAGGMEKLVLVSGPHVTTNGRIFTLRAALRFDAHVEALAWIVGQALLHEAPPFTNGPSIMCNGCGIVRVPMFKPFCNRCMQCTA